MPVYKLHYFDVKGLGEAVRLTLHYVGQPFEDIRFTHEQWPEIKSKFFYEKVPVLEVDGGKQLSQSGAILRFLGEKHGNGGLLGKDEWERAKVNELFDYYKDVYAELFAYFMVKKGFCEGNVEQLHKDVFVPGAATHFPRFVKLLAQSGSGFFVPSGPTFVDFVLAEYFDNATNYTTAVAVEAEMGPTPEAADDVPQMEAGGKENEKRRKRRWY